MSIPSHVVPGGAESGEVLYTSASTRVMRLESAPGAGWVISKVYLGPQAAQRLRNEKNLLARLAGTEGVAQLSGSGLADKGLTLHDCGGITLAQRLEQGRFDVPSVVSMGCQLARILADIHGAGVLHRDINPANILVTASGQCVLIDFDLAAQSANDPEAEPRSRMLGTLRYMPPEQTGRTGRPVDQRSDLYALGATLYEMATGRVPFEQPDALQLIHDHLVKEPLAPSQADERVPAVLSGIILRLLAKAPENRYQSAEGLFHDMQRLRANLGRGESASFELGERDFPLRLEPPTRLVGREPELALLRGAFDDAMHTPRRTVLVDGPAGVGKSALIDELRPVVEKAGGWFVYGKFDQFQREASTSGALTQALRSLGRLLLTQSAEAAAATRTRILEALGPNVGFIARASPEFGLLLDVPVDAPEIDPRQAELKLQQSILDLLLVVASPASPLVVVVDDLQWAGIFSLRFFERMMMEPHLRGLLLVGSYRVEESESGQLLSSHLVKWQQLDAPPARIPLANLTSAGIFELATRMLRLAPARASELAEALVALTKGNPFDTIELINQLRNEGILSLDADGWQWDDAKVRRFIGRGTVVDLLAARIARLPAPSLELLECMSCLGSVVDATLLRVAAGLREDELRDRMRAPLEEGLVLADDSERVRFRHDRVQQALLGARADTQRDRRQLDMARRLAAEPAFAGEAAQQYLACVHLLDDPAEKRIAARLFHDLAQVLARTATFMLAERFLAAAQQLLESIDDPADAATRRSIAMQRHSALYGLGRVSECDEIYAGIEASTKDPLDLVDPAGLQIRSLTVSGRMREALALGVRLLAQLGLEAPPDFVDPARPQRIAALGQWIVQERRLDPLKRAQMREPRLLGISKLLARMLGSAYLMDDSNAQEWIVLEGQRLWAEHGPEDNLMGCVGNLGSMLVQHSGDYRTAYEIGRHLIEVGELLGFEMRTAGARWSFCWGAAVWFDSLESTLVMLAKAEAVMAAKAEDPSFLAYFGIIKAIATLELAPTLEICDADIDNSMVLCRRTGNVHAAAFLHVEQQFLRALQGRTRAADSFDDDQFDEARFLQKFAHLKRIGQGITYFHALRAVLWGDAQTLSRQSPLGARSQYTGSNSTLYRAVIEHLIAALARAWELRTGDAADPGRQPRIDDLERRLRWFRERAADQPHNFLHLMLLAEAEAAWALGDLWQAAASFDGAVLESETRQRPWHRALILERAGVFNIARGLTGAGRALLAKARDQYEAWGASAKVEHLDSTHPFLRAPARSLSVQLASGSQRSIDSSRNVSSDVLDLVGVLRASQALSSETSQDQLSQRVTEVLASLSGATKVLVLSMTEGKWVLHAPAPGVPSMPVTDAAERGLLPMSAFAYAQRTGEVLAVDDAKTDFRFARDPYFAGLTVCSLLMVPIQGQGHARALLLLENRLGRAAFNAQRLDAVMLVAGQLAVSMSNAQLYESLEQRVAARTRELQQTQAELVTTARRAGMAEVANNVLHNVGNVLNSIIVSTSVLRGNIANSRIHGLARAVDLINEHWSDIPKFIETDPRGAALLPYLDQLVEALRSEQQEALANLDRLARSVEHITYVVSTQQAHAGPSSVLEVSGLQEVIEDALRLREDALERYGISVSRHYEDIPKTAVDRQRLVQILVNLIGNAAQAMENVPANARQLTIRTARARGEHGELMRISVQDSGEGIAPEHVARIFSHGFTTRASGHGFGLHSSALAATEMGGNLSVHSDGPGRGAIFTIELPLT